MYERSSAVCERSNIIYTRSISVYFSEVELCTQDRCRAVHIKKVKTCLCFLHCLPLAYRFHSLASNGVFLPSEQVPYRNFTSQMYGMRFQFELKSYANLPKIESRICLSCLVPYLPCLEIETETRKVRVIFSS